MCDPKDCIMADKGFNVQDLFAANNISVSIPSIFTTKKGLIVSVPVKAEE